MCRIYVDFIVLRVVHICSHINVVIKFIDWIYNPGAGVTATHCYQGAEESYVVSIHTTQGATRRVAIRYDTPRHWCFGSLGC